MRTPNTLTPAITIALAAIALSMLGAPPAAAQTPSPVLGVQYDLMAVDNLNLHGLVVDYDRPVWGDHIRFAAGGAFATATERNLSASQTFFGAGPGIRHDTGSLEVYAHALFGYRRDSGRIGRFGGSESGFDTRFSGGIDYPLGPGYSMRAGAAYGGNAHVTAGMAFRF